MKQIFSLLIIASIMLVSCRSTPQEYFSQAVLNCNLLYGFAGNGMQQELASPSEKLINENTGATAPMTRAEVLKDKLQNIQAAFEKVKQFSITDDTKEMVNASMALYEYVLPVYKNEYRQLAALYDEGAATEKIDAAEKNITGKYEARFLQLHNDVLLAGKAYATRHGIKVLEVDPSPSNN